MWTTQTRPKAGEGRELLYRSCWRCKGFLIPRNTVTHSAAQSEFSVPMTLAEHRPPSYNPNGRSALWTYPGMGSLSSSLPRRCTGPPSATQPSTTSPRHNHVELMPSCHSCNLSTTHCSNLRHRASPSSQTRYSSCGIIFPSPPPCFCCLSMPRRRNFVLPAGLGLFVNHHATGCGPKSPTALHNTHPQCIQCLRAGTNALSRSDQVLSCARNW